MKGVPRKGQNGRSQWELGPSPSGLTLHRLLHVAAAPLPCGGARSTASSSSSPSHAAQAPPLLLLPLKAHTQARQPHPRGTSRMRLRGPRAGRPARNGVRDWDRHSEQRQRLLQQPPSRCRSREECRAARSGLPRCPHGTSLASGPQPSTSDRLQPLKEASPRESRTQTPPSRAPRPAPRRRRCHTPALSRAPIGCPPSAAPPPPATGSYVTSTSSRVRSLCLGASSIPGCGCLFCWTLT